MSLFSWIAKSCDEDTGQPSAMRLVVLYGSFVSLTVPGVLWIAAVHWPLASSAAAGASTFFGATLAALLTAKVWQKGKEADPTPATAATPAA